MLITSSVGSQSVMAMRSDARLEEEVEVEENFGPQPISRLEVGAPKHLDRAWFTSSLCVCSSSPLTSSHLIGLEV